MPELSSELDRPDIQVHPDMDVTAGDLPRVEISGGSSATGNGLVLKPEGTTDATFGEDESETASADQAGAPGAVQFELTEAAAVEAAIAAARSIVDEAGPGDDDELVAEVQREDNGGDEAEDRGETVDQGDGNRLPPPPENSQAGSDNQNQPDGKFDPTIPPAPAPHHFIGRLRRDMADANVSDDPTVYGLESAGAVRANVVAARKFTAESDRNGDTDTPAVGEEAGDNADSVAGQATDQDDEVGREAGHQPPGNDQPPNGGGGEHGDGDNEDGEGRRLYTPSDVARHIARDRVVLSGVSPEVGRQNQELVGRFRQTAAEVGDSVIAVQFIGSRSNGTSGLDSDLDAAVITFGDINREEARQPFYDAADAMHVSADLDLAGRAAGGIPDEVPEDPEEFLQWVEHGVGGSEDAPISLFDDGVYRTDDQLLLRLAVVEVIGSYPYADQRADNWQSVRDRHAAEYLGDLDTMRERLTQRLGAEHEEEVRRALSQQLMRERRERFGLPADMGAYQQRLARWAMRNDARLQPTRGHQLLRAVRSAL